MIACYVVVKLPEIAVIASNCFTNDYHPMNCDIIIK